MLSSIVHMVALTASAVSGNGPAFVVVALLGAAARFARAKRDGSLLGWMDAAGKAIAMAAIAWWGNSVWFIGFVWAIAGLELLMAALPDRRRKAVRS